MIRKIAFIVTCALSVSACNDQPSQFDGNWSFANKGCNSKSHLISRAGVVYLMVTPEGVPVMRFGSLEENKIVPVELIDRGYTVRYSYDGTKLTAAEIQSPSGALIDANADPKTKGSFDLVRCTTL